MKFRVRATRKKTGEKRRGAALVEMAVVLPVFFMIVLGIIEFGRAMMVTQIVTNCAREATRSAVLEGATNTTVESFVTDYVGKSLNLSSADVATTITVEDPNGVEKGSNSVAAASRLDLIRVAVAVPYSKVNFMPIRWLDGTSISGASVMRREH